MWGPLIDFVCGASKRVLHNFASKSVFDKALVSVSPSTFNSLKSIGRNSFLRLFRLFPMVGLLLLGEIFSVSPLLRESVEKFGHRRLGFALYDSMVLEENEVMVVMYLVFVGLLSTN